ncbi:Uma2 family endonuclease [Streptomyces sp. NBC_00102]|uniref:Uma2 family endonuclease n=1 Tax=Streptomyces sp. NBC_00102 TaxID=2975652 RepID=UPI0022546C39|nr:Uma2 family endonuclease [Streptomyces sp. NBC_00102]MCX5397601.1 Uma2 family endonuclease [Streptomyces sp. NBC_00102]
MNVGPEVPEPRWAVPPEGGWTADDLDTLPNLPPHTELIDGSLVFACPQTLFHSLAISFLGRQLQVRAPKELEALSRFTIDIDRHNRPEPDVLVVDAAALAALDQTRVPADAVRPAIEIVSAESLSRDRETKPVKYARARIPHFWRVENQDGRAVVYVFEREPATGAYTSTAIFHDRLKVSVPFPIDLDLDAITAPRRAAEPE